MADSTGSSTDAGLDAQDGSADMDGGTDSGADAAVEGMGIRCLVATHYAPSDIATLGEQRWSIAGDELVRTDLSFDVGTTELTGDFSELHSTGTYVAVRLETAEVRVRDDSGSWAVLDGVDGTLGGSGALVVSDGDQFWRWTGALVNIPGPGEPTFAFTASDSDIYAGADGSIWHHDGTAWTETSTAPLAVAPGPPLPPVDSLLVSAPTPTGDGALVFGYTIERSSTYEYGVAVLRDGVFTKLAVPPALLTIHVADGGLLGLTTTGFAFQLVEGSGWEVISGQRGALWDAGTTWSVGSVAGIHSLEDWEWVLSHPRQMPFSLSGASPDTGISSSFAYGVVADGTGTSKLVRWDDGWIRTGVAGPSVDRGLAWTPENVFFMLGGEGSERLYRWTMGVEESLGPFNTNRVVAHPAHAFVLDRYSILGHRVRRWDGPESGFSSLPNLFCQGARLVTAGTDGLVATGCESEASGPSARWLDADAWENIAALNHIGHVAGPGGTAIFHDEAAENYPTFDGIGWSTLDLSWVDSPAHVAGPASDNLVAFTEGRVLWRSGGEVATLDDVRIGAVHSISVQTDRFLALATPPGFLTPDASPALRTFDCSLVP